MVTAAQIRKFAPGAKSALVNAIVANWSVAIAAVISTDLRVQHFFAQIATETGGLRSVDESLTYTSVARIRAVWPSRFKTDADAKPFVRQPEKLAIKVYGGRMGNAPAPSSDGWDYRGGGMLQTTGREGYRKMGFEANPAALRDPETAFRTAVREWSNRGCNAMADRDDVTAIRKVINGGTNGLSEAKNFLKKAKLVFVSGRTQVSQKASLLPSQPVNIPVPVPKPAAASQEDVIRQVQDLLWDKGYPEVGESDGKFGPRTRNSILAFQADNNLPLSGKVSDELLAQLVKAPVREMGEKRKSATKEDVKSEPVVQTGDWLQKIGGTILGGSILGGGIDSLDGLNDRLSSMQTLYATISSFAPWLIGIAAGGAAIYFGSRIIRKFVEAYREGRAF